MSIRSEAQRVVSIARELGLQAGLYQSEVSGNGSPKEYLVEVRRGGDTGDAGVVRVANFPDGRSVRVGGRAVPWLVDTRIADLGPSMSFRKRSSGEAGGGVRFVLAAISALARWAGIDHRLTHAMKRRAIRRSRGARTARATRVQGVETKAETLAARICAEPQHAENLWRNDAADMAVADWQNQAVSLVLDGVTRRCSPAKAGRMGFPPGFMDRLAPVAFAALPESIADMLADRDLWTPDEVEALVWDALVGYPLRYRTQQGDALMSAFTVLLRRGEGMEHVPDVLRYAADYWFGVPMQEWDIATTLGIRDRGALVALVETWAAESADAPHCSLWACVSSVQRNDRLHHALREPYRTDTEVRCDVERLRVPGGYVLSVPRLATR